jgi:hypothetical protein
MDKTAIQSSVPPAGDAAPAGVPPRAKPARKRNPLVTALTALASLRLTVVLFVLAMLLVFFGTLAQVDLGIWTVVDRYFRSLAVWVPLQIFFPRTFRVPGSFPFPGGWLLGGLLLTNLLAAHAVRFKLGWKRAGILLIHSGLIVMMLSEFITGVFAVEGNMIIVEGGSSNFVQDSRNPELAVLSPADDKTDDVVAVPASFLQKGGKISHDALPFDVEVVRYMLNSSKPAKPEPGQDNPATAGDGKFEVSVERPEVSGTDPQQKVDFPSAYLRLTDKQTGADLGTYLVSLWYYVEDRPQTVKVGDKEYELFLRFERSYKPYTMHLIDFNHELYPGTETPKDFSSVVRLEDPSNNEDREVRIWMNHPLRYRGETFFQSSFLEGDTGTILQVVRNPGWLMPYISCGMVSTGLLIHFGINLVGFLKKRSMGL